jgi:hypothetical protein
MDMDMDMEKTDEPNKKKKFIGGAKDRRLIIIGGAAVVLLLLVFIILFQGGNPIEELTVQNQTSNGVEVSNYVSVLKEGYDWAKASDAKRRKIAIDAVNEALAQVEKDRVGIYNIMGKDSADRVIFLYNAADKTVRIEVNGEIKETVPV